MKRFKEHLQEGKIKSFIDKMKKKLSDKSKKVISSIMTQGVMLTKMTSGQVEEIAERLGIELDANELHHIMHVFHELGHVGQYAFKFAVKLLSNTELEGERLDEGRPRLVKFMLKKNHVKWTCKNMEDGKIYYIKINETNSESSISVFLHSIKAVDEYTYPRTNELHNFKGLLKELVTKGSTIFWVPENRINIIKTTWSYKQKH